MNDLTQQTILTTLLEIKSDLGASIQNQLNTNALLQTHIEEDLVLKANVESLQKDRNKFVYIIAGMCVTWVAHVSGGIQAVVKMLGFV